MDAELQRMTIKRPTAEQVQATWGQLLSLWGDATDKERQTLMGSIVRNVEVKQKDLVLLELSPTPEVQGHCLRQTRTIEREYLLFRTIRASTWRVLRYKKPETYAKR